MEVQRQTALVLDTCAPGPIPILSICAGQGRDVIGALATHPRGSDALARLVELDESNAAFARELAHSHGLTNVDVVVADASTTDAYEGAVPAALVMVCGVFGNISERDIARTVSYMPSLCAPGARVIWTRHRREPDITPSLRATFERVGFVEEQFVAPDDALYAVGTHRLDGAAGHFSLGRHLFTFLTVDSSTA
jgi:Putative methyltransferase